MKKLSALALIAIVSLPLAGCGRAVSIDLKLVEPCDQKDQALNGVKSYVLSSVGGNACTETVTENCDVTEPVAFNIDGGAQPLSVPLGVNVIVSAEAFTDDVSAEAAANATPQAVGRTMPLTITESTADISGMLLTGKAGTFGKTTASDGECSSMTPEAAQKGRHGHTATYVPGLNQVLIVGGAVWVDNEERFLNSAELWDPITGAFNALEDITARAYHAASALPDGRVLITGGFGVIGGEVTTLITGLLFDPETKTFKTIQLRQPRAHHTSTYMPGPNLIAIVGGCTGSDAGDGCTPTAAGSGPDGASTDLPVNMETFDPEQDISTAAVANGLLVGRAFHQANVLGEGAAQVLVVSGGANADGTVCDLEFFQLAGSSLSRVDSQATPFLEGKCPARHAGIELGADRILVTGGQTQAPGGLPSGPGSAEAFFIGLGAINGVDAGNAIPLQAGRHGHTTAFLDGAVLIIGGAVTEGGVVAERLAAQSSGSPLSSSPVNGLQSARDHAALAKLPNNQLFYSGGHTTTQPFSTQASAEIYFGR